MTPKVSIIIPVYNAERYLRECLDSAAAQTLREIEILCIDDGSTDSSGTICDEYAAQDERFRVYHQKNAGQSAARNAGIEQARGEYVAFLDSDDWLAPTFCETTFKSAETTGAEMTQVFFQFNIKCSKKEPRLYQADEITEEVEKLRTVQENWSVIWDFLWRRDFLIRNNLRFPVGIIFEDTVFSYVAAVLTNKIVVIPERLYHYRVGSGYSSFQKRNSNYLRFVEMFTAITREYGRRGFSSEANRFIRIEKILRVFRVYWFILPFDCREKYKQEILKYFTDEDWAAMRDRSNRFSTRIRCFYLPLKERSWLNPLRKAYVTLRLAPDLLKIYLQYSR